MNKYLILFLYSILCRSGFSQITNDTIRDSDVKEILAYLSSNQMKGRVNYTPELITAAKYIGEKFREYGLQTMPGHMVFFHPFKSESSDEDNKISRDIVNWNGKSLNSDQFLYVSSLPEIIPKKLSDFKLVSLQDSLPPVQLLCYYWQSIIQCVMTMNAR